LITMFLNSTLYHSLFYVISSHFVLQALDHTGIYLLIAGSYTPVMVLGCDDGFRTAIMVTFYWLCAAFGVGLAIYAPWPKPRWYERISLVLYVGMGIAGGPFILFSEHCLAVRELVLTQILAGGATFLCGVPFFVSSVEFPTFHIVWHVFVCGLLYHNVAGNPSADKGVAGICVRWVAPPGLRSLLLVHLVTVEARVLDTTVEIQIVPEVARCFCCGINNDAIASRRAEAALFALI